LIISKTNICADELNSQFTINQFTNFDNDLQISNAIYLMTGDNYENDMLIIRQSKMDKEESDNDNDLELKSENVHVTTASAYDYERGSAGTLVRRPES
jgi:hypothetical protein